MHLNHRANSALARFLTPWLLAGSVNPDYEKLITDCWHRDPSVRPTFLEVMTRLSAMIEEGGGGGGTSSSSSRASSGGYLNRTYASLFWAVAQSEP